jgi:hypothetical protein
MAFHRSRTIEQWWPTTQALDLVEGPVEAVAAAVLAEVSRFVVGESLRSSWKSFANLDAAFGTATEFTNVPTFYLVLPTRTQWTVLWNNSFLCDGYDSLCHCITKNHRLTTLHWSAHDEWTTFQSGASFTHRHANGSAVVERSVYVAQTDRHWDFFQSGPPLPEEEVQLYTARRKRDRLNEEHLSHLLARLGASPWSEEFYALPGRCFAIHRHAAPETITRRRREEVLANG